MTLEPLSCTRHSSFTGNQCIVSLPIRVIPIPLQGKGGPYCDLAVGEVGEDYRIILATSKSLKVEDFNAKHAHSAFLRPQYVYQLSFIKCYISLSILA